MRKIQPFELKYRNFGLKGFASFFRIFEKDSGRLLAAIDEDSPGIFCNHNAPVLRENEFIVKCLAEGVVDKVIDLEQSISKNIGFKGDKAFIFLYDRDSDSYKIVDFVKYVLDNREKLTSDLFHNFKE